jgi:hypothetical protein
MAFGIRHRDHQRMGNAQHGAKRSEPGDSAERRLRSQTTRVGSTETAASAEVNLGPEYQMALELRPAHDPTRAYGFLGVVVSLKDLSASIWVWHRDNGKWSIEKVIDIPAEPADAGALPLLLQGFKAVPPLITDIDLSLRRPLPVRLLLWNRRISAIGRLRSFPSAQNGIGAPGWNRAQGRASQAAQDSAERSSANGRGQPRWPTHLLH